MLRSIVIDNQVYNNYLSTVHPYGYESQCSVQYCSDTLKVFQLQSQANIWMQITKFS